MGLIKIADVMAFLVENRAPDLPPKALAEVFDKLIWCLSNNGGELLEVRRNWLSGDDPVKVEIALQMTETMPHHTRDETVQCFNRLVAKWPQYKKRCDEIISDWDKILKKT